MINEKSHPKKIIEELSSKAYALTKEGKTGIVFYITTSIFNVLRAHYSGASLNTFSIVDKTLAGWPFKVVLMYGGSWFVAHSESRLETMKDSPGVYIHPDYKAPVCLKAKQEAILVGGKVKVEAKRNSDLGDEFATSYYSCTGCDTPVDPSWKICPKCVKQLIFPEEEDLNNG